MHRIEGSTSGDNKGEPATPAIETVKGKWAVKTPGTTKATKATKTNDPNANYNPSKKDHNSNNNGQSIDADSIIPCLAYLCASSIVYTHRRKNIARGERTGSVWSLANIAVDGDIPLDKSPPNSPASAIGIHYAIKITVYRSFLRLTT